MAKAKTKKEVNKESEVKEEMEIKKSPKVKKVFNIYARLSAACEIQDLYGNVQVLNFPKDRLVKLSRDKMRHFIEDRRNYLTSGIFYTDDLDALIELSEGLLVKEDCTKMITDDELKEILKKSKDDFDNFEKEFEKIDCHAIRAIVKDLIINDGYVDSYKMRKFIEDKTMRTSHMETLKKKK